MLTIDSQFESSLRKRIEEEIQQLSSDIANGNAPDFAVYKAKAGEIKGLRTALELADETRKTILNN